MHFRLSMKKHFEGPIASIDSSSRFEGRELFGSGGYGEDVYASGSKGARYLAEHRRSIEYVLQHILRDHDAYNQHTQAHTHTYTQSMTMIISDENLQQQQHELPILALSRHCFSRSRYTSLESRIFSPHLIRAEY